MRAQDRGAIRAIMAFQKKKKGQQQVAATAENKSAPVSDASSSSSSSATNLSALPLPLQLPAVPSALPSEQGAPVIGLLEEPAAAPLPASASSSVEALDLPLPPTLAVAGTAASAANPKDDVDDEILALEAKLAALKQTKSENSM
mmetsp:Transcript_63879/g.109672  ORF Transcript_63879/g.109672 Transcript_63879/m.109672 type:complete len:145 (-) Transcript_63879:249-683(-)